MKKKGNQIFYLLIAIVVVIIFISSINLLNKNREKNIRIPVIPNLPESIILTHKHVDFKVFLEGKEVDFNKIEYNVANPLIHLHTNNPNGGGVIHIEAEGIPIGIFFQSLAMNFSSSCFILDGKQSFCNAENKKLRFFVNGIENFEFDNYIAKDLDRILITYGNLTKEEIQKQMDGVSKDACIYSNKCPERTPKLPEGQTLEF